MSGHAILPASGSGKWIACTPAPRLEQQFPNKSSSFAEEGTCAHAVGEFILRILGDQVTGDYVLEMLGQEPDYLDIKPHQFEDRIWVVLMRNPYYSKELHDYADGYAHFVWAMCKPGTFLFIEQRLDMTDYVEEGFGTGDGIVVGNKILRLSDLKYGKGVPVYADNNSQLMLYALGAYKEFSHIFDIEVIEINIYQPRLDNISTWEITVKDLLYWAENVLKPKAILAYKGEGDFNPGKHCLFCRAKPVCRALADHNMKLAQLEFKNPDILTDEEVSEVLEKVDGLIKWAGSVKDHVLATALSGKEWPNWKLVEGRANRKYSSEPEVIEKLTKAGHTNIYTEPKLLGLGALEKAVTKPVFKQIVEPLLIKPEGAATLAPLTDSRPVYSPKNHDFIAYTEDDA